MPQRVPLEAGCFYHIYNHANGNENLFPGAENYFFFLRKYVSFLEESIETLAYCLLPNYQSLLSDKPTLLRRREVLEWFGGKKEFIEFHKWKPDDRWSHLLE